MESESQVERQFDALFVRYSGPLFAFLYGRLGGREIASDLTQETFVRAWTHIETLSARDEAGRQRWLFAVARNLVVDLRRRGAADPLGRAAPLADADERGPGAPDTISERACLRAIDEAIAGLPEILREVLVMSVLEGMSSEEIGACIECPAGTVRFRLSKARKRLAKYLEGGHL